MLQGNLSYIVVWALLYLPLGIAAEFECNQAGRAGSPTVWEERIIHRAGQQYTIDYAVFFTPQAAAAEGGTQKMVERVQKAFEGANLLFAQSGASISHRVVLSQELPFNNTSTTLPELNTELAQGFDFIPVIETVMADSVVIVVESQVPGGFANIPLSPSRARNGGLINLGRRNLVASVLAHEMGHTLGASHDYPESSGSFFDFTERFPYGNHFIGKGSNECYRTLMSALIDCRLPGFTGLPAKPCNCFSNPLVTFDDTATGETGKADAVGAFMDYAPFLASNRGGSQLPDPTPTATPSPGEPHSPPDTSQPTPTAAPPPDSGVADPWHMLSFSIKRGSSARRVLIVGRCQNRLGVALAGDALAIFRGDNNTTAAKRVKSLICSARGDYRVELLKRRGVYFVRHLKSKTDTPSKRI
jgi:hypothetical protein